MADFLYYITQNGVLRSMQLSKKEVFEEIIDEVTYEVQPYTCIVTEKYLVTGLYLDGSMVNPQSGWNLIEAGLRPIEPFLFIASNKIFRISDDDYRLENIPFEIFFRREKIFV